MDNTTAVVIALGFIAQLFIMLWTRWDAYRKAIADAMTAAQAREDAAKAQTAANDAKAAADKAAMAAVDASRRVATVKEDVVNEAQKVKDTLAASDKVKNAKLDELAHTADATHALVNNNMAVQLNISAMALHRVAELTQHPDDVAASDLAAKLYREHMAKQAKHDARQAMVHEEPGRDVK